MSGETVTIKLRKPIKSGSETITELVLREPRAKDLRKFPMTPNMGDMLDLAGKLAGQPPHVMDDLHVQDLTEVAEAIGNFMHVGPVTGSGPLS